MRKGKTKVGVVVSDAMDKSVTVMVERVFMEPLFKKYIRRKKKFMAHDEKNECSKGDVVMIRECSPLSKMKRWCVETILEKGVQ
ncbi:MAG TPA: 30S ribosomal protein S17 [bacterium]|jgi:small subunit ribosomal protein S17|nr:30S ribosomal protein S17 [Myxococcales bacterium]OQA58625.1 MAG: 30S ribosomal protein S17 [bacterium ADurb.Bin270]HPW45371.1 30S ribosomal protein S17 [bacterium]HQH80205.1 30S ribosomal protein S17 [bacterium]